ncbi:MAG: SUMF1/EgtB/PvdO family nonheme iron enzyme [Cyanobacteria bacterium P01_F01_bin.143]
MTRIFISHSHADQVIAKKLVDYLLAALTVGDADIRCTSVSGHKLPPGKNIEGQLKKEINGDIALIGILTQSSLRSQWVLFELGAAWGMGKLVIPVLGAGVKKEDLPGPLKGYIPVSIEDQEVAFALNDMIGELASNLNEIEEKFRNRNSAERIRNELIRDFKAWKPQIPPQSSELAQSQEIEKLEARIQELKQNLSEAQSQLKSQKLSHSQELQDQAREINLKVQQLEQELAKARSQLAQVQESAVNASRAHKDQLHKELEQKDNEIMRLREKLVEQNQVASQNLKSFSFEVVTVNEKGQEIKREPKQASYFAEKLGNNITLEMVSIPGGKFIMGTEDQEIERLVKKFGWDGYRREQPQHEVTVQPFYMGKFQITQAQWQVIASLPKLERDLELEPSSFNGENRPVEKVSWEDAVEFCQRLSQKTGNEYRLPSEAEWEYACRSVMSEGLTLEVWNREYCKPFYFGETITDKLANYHADYIYASESKGEYCGETAAVGKYPPNAFGLYDLHGNVWEWCEDDLHDSYKNTPTDGSAWLSGESSDKVIRGGSWDSYPYNCRSAIRRYFTRGDRLSNIGFRVVCVAPSNK